MSIKVIKGGDIFTSKANIYVNATNASGVMGGGIAKLFRAKWPEYYSHYMREYSAGQLRMGKVNTFFTSSGTPEIIASLHTMLRPGSAADLPAIIAGLNNLKTFMVGSLANSVAIPALGCGIGGLNFAILQSEVEDCFATAPELEVELYAPL